MDSETRMWKRLWVLLAEDDWDQTVYVYRVNRSGKTVKPFAAKWSMHSDLIESIRDDFGAGEYHLMIRAGQNHAIYRNHRRRPSTRGTMAGRLVRLSAQTLTTCALRLWRRRQSTAASVTSPRTDWIFWRARLSQQLWLL